MPVLGLFLLLPLIEIAGFILVGGWLGLWPTLGLVVLAAIAGVIVIRRQGMGLQLDMRREMDSMRDPLSPLAHRAMKVAAGFLLILPGFFSDLVAIGLLIRPLRQVLISAVSARMAPVATATRRENPGGITVIDAEYFEVPPDGSAPPRRGRSAWSEGPDGP